MHLAEFLGLPARELVTRSGRVAMVDVGQGPTVLLVHGNPTWSFQWRDVIGSLMRDHRVVALDQPGFGRSERRGAYRWETFLQAAEDVAEQVGRCTVVGHDWGGALAVHVALEKPREVEGLVLMEPQLFAEEWDDYAGERRERFRRFRDEVLGPELILQSNVMVEQIGDGVLRDLSTDEMEGYRLPFPTPDSRLAVLRLVQMKPIGPDSETYDYFVELERRLPSLTIPLTLLTVDSGPLMPHARVERLRASVSSPRVVHLGAGRHHFHEDHALAIAELLRSGGDHDGARDHE